MEHALSCAKGGFPTIRHNEMQDFTASLLTEICDKVCVEPQLQPVTSDQLNGASANRQNGARLDVSANGVWGGRFQKTYLDVHVTHSPPQPKPGTSCSIQKARIGEKASLLATSTRCPSTFGG